MVENKITLNITKKMLNFDKCVFCMRPGCRMRCSRCKTLYCSETCQRLDWTKHSKHYCILHFDSLKSIQIGVTKRELYQQQYYNNEILPDELEQAKKGYVGEKYPVAITDDDIGVRVDLEPDWYPMIRNMYEHINGIFMTMNITMDMVGPFQRAIICYIALIHSKINNISKTTAPGQEQVVSLPPYSPGASKQYVSQSPGSSNLESQPKENSYIHDPVTCAGDTLACLNYLCDLIRTDRLQFRNKLFTAMKDAGEKIFPSKPERPTVKPSKQRVPTVFLPGTRATELVKVLIPPQGISSDTPFDETYGILVLAELLDSDATKFRWEQKIYMHEFWTAVQNTFIPAITDYPLAYDKQEKLFHQAFMAVIDFTRMTSSATIANTTHEKIVLSIKNYLETHKTEVGTADTKIREALTTILKDVQTGTLDASQMLLVLVELAALGLNWINGKHPKVAIDVLSKYVKDLEQDELANPVISKIKTVHRIKDLVTTLRDSAKQYAITVCPAVRATDPDTALRMVEFMRLNDKTMPKPETDTADIWQPKNILSIDGGGLKGITVLKMLLSIFSVEAPITRGLWDQNGDDVTAKINDMVREWGSDIVLSPCTADQCKKMPMERHYHLMTRNPQNPEMGDWHFEPKLYTLEVLPGPNQCAPYQVFDLVCGTSTGSLIAFWIALKRAPLMCMLAKYFELGQAIFPPQSTAEMAKNLVIEAGARFKPGPLEEQLTQLAGDNYLFDKKYAYNGKNWDDKDKTPRFFCTSVAESSAALQFWIFTNYETEVVRSAVPSRINDELSGVTQFTVCATSCIKVKDALRCSTAAPTYLPPKKIEGKDWVEAGNAFVIAKNLRRTDINSLAIFSGFNFADGGIGNNNPTVLALIEAGRCFNGLQNVGLVFSVGTGFAFLAKELTAKKPMTSGQLITKGAQKIFGSKSKEPVQPPPVAPIESAPSGFISKLMYYAGKSLSGVKAVPGIIASVPDAVSSAASSTKGVLQWMMIGVGMWVLKNKAPDIANLIRTKTGGFFPKGNNDTLADAISELAPTIAQTIDQGAGAFLQSGFFTTLINVGSGSEAGVIATAEIDRAYPLMIFERLSVQFQEEYDMANYSLLEQMLNDAAVFVDLAEVKKKIQLITLRLTARNLEQWIQVRQV